MSEPSGAAGKTHTAELLVAYGQPPDPSCPALGAGKPLTAVLQQNR